jgi:signal peptidase II
MSPPDRQLDATGGKACRSPLAIALFLGVVAVGLAADLYSKHQVFSELINDPTQSRVLVNGLLRFRLSTNPGIVFGLRVPPWTALAATAAAVVMVMLIFATSARRFWGLHLALGMVVGGALGNAYDRLFCRLVFDGALRTGQVRDFIDVYPINYPIFNVADILLVVGVGLIMLHLLRHQPPKP